MKFSMKPYRRYKESAKLWLYFFVRFTKHSNAFQKTEMGMLAGISTKFHIVEKGLAMPKVRYFFGAENILKLIDEMLEYDSLGFNKLNTQYVSAVIVLSRYKDLHLDRPLPDDGKIKGLFEKIDSFLVRNTALLTGNDGVGGGSKQVFLKEYTEQSRGDFAAICHARSTIRNFIDKEVDSEVVKRAVKLAQRCPSTCNRQTPRIYHIKDKQLIDKALTIHNGTRGFNENISCLLVVCGDLRATQGIKDLNQVYVDSGIFAMNLLYSLQYNGLGACILHWAVSTKVDKKLRKLLSIKDAHNVSCMIGVGYMPDEFNVAYSERLSVDDILTTR
ncbi:hypothetical protein SIN8267_02966 [Sinobacterium norvegicum]|uniref:Nitroreductase domain-containing protein n=1 Tax=Sinobacterium norvegicum TaxID=1641715 RepID=A0ABM9AI01_9GAMM|nr:nitroreductase family protein [Sinobacterium norvegicum]CAH0992829.1 hypothetical protein SIN8267_02966 [Sinobacterium norvegicum]